MSTVTKDQVYDQLRTVNDPELHKDLVTLNMIKDVGVDGGAVHVQVELTTPACPLKDQIGRDVEQAIRKIPGVTKVSIDWSAQVRSSRATSTLLPNVKNIIAVGAGKGGVGKSTAAVALAYGLHRAGAKVGLMDADVYGPSIPTMTGVEGHRPSVRGEMIVTPEAGGVKIMSIGFMVDRDKALASNADLSRGVFHHIIHCFANVIRSIRENLLWNAAIAEAANAPI